MKGRISDEQRIVHILDAINEIGTYTSGLDFTDFKQNSMAKFATVKQLEIIGEASKNISSEMRLTYPSVEWDQIAALRNILVHEYFGIDFDLVWQIIQVDVKALQLALLRKKK